MTKEEILKGIHAKRIMNYEDVFRMNPSIIQSAYDAMDEYAEQESILFSEWAAEKGWEKHVGENLWRNRMGYATEYTTEELYLQYKN